jgi:hypothetical protein
MWINAGMVPERSKLAPLLAGANPWVLLRKAMFLLNLSTGLPILPATLSAL